MDVSLRIRAFRFLTILFTLNLFLSCGSRFDLGTPRGRQARIDDANFHLSQGSCAAAMASIDPLYDSSYVDDEVRVIKASVYACYAGFNFLTLAANLSGSTNYFSVLAKSMSNSAGDGARSYLYSAIDVLTQSGAKTSGSARGSSVNTYMIFVQLATVAALLRNYGNPDADGTQRTSIGYVNAPNNMSNEDGCAMASAFAYIADSYSYSSLTDGDTSALVSFLNVKCGGNCSSLNKSRSACDGSNASSVTAGAIVSAVDAAW